MASGGRAGFEAVAWFNGGLFDDDRAVPLEWVEIDTALKAAALDWSEIDPSILEGCREGQELKLACGYVIGTPPGLGRAPRRIQRVKVLKKRSCRAHGGDIDFPVIRTAPA